MYVRVCVCVFWSLNGMSGYVRVGRQGSVCVCVCVCGCVCVYACVCGEVKVILV